MPVPPTASDHLNTPPPANEPRLEYWGEIALHLKRDIRTVQRWEKFGLPVRRVRIGEQDRVYAYRSELDKWLLERQPKPGEDPVNGGENDGNKDEIGPVVVEPMDPDNATVVEVPQHSLRRKTVAGGLALMTALLGVALWVKLSAPANRAEPPKVLLFVRPFSSESEDPQELQFVTGLTNDLITHLGRMDPQQLIVFAPTTSGELAGKTIPELRNILNADFVLEGSVRRDGDRLRIEAALISATNQNAKWTKAYTDAVGNILKFQDEVSDDVANELSTAMPNFVSPSKRSIEPGKVDPAVYEAYQRGRVFWLDRDLGRSMYEYQLALKKDPHYAPALAGLASTYLLLGQSPNDAMRASDSVPKARAAAQQALAIDNTLADADCVLANIAMVYDHNLAEAERLFKKAIQEDPSNVTAHEWYGYFLMVTNHMSEAEEEIKQALSFDPEAPLVSSAAAEVKYYRRDFDGAIRQASSTLAKHKGFLYAVFWLGSAYREKKMYREALEQFELACRLTQDHPAMLWAYGHTLAVAGRREEAQAVLAKLLTIKQTQLVPALYVAGMYAGLGDKEQSFHWLDQAADEHDDRIIYLNVDPLADPLRGDARFNALMKGAGLP